MLIKLSVLLFIAFTGVLNPLTTHTVKSCQEDKQGQLEFKTGEAFQHKVIPIHYFVPEGDVSAMSIQIILHGASRNADEYMESWIEKSREYGIILLAPEFTKAQFTIGEYNQGMMVDTMDQLRPLNQTLFSLLDPMFEYAKSELNLQQETYNLFGHSAGGQFVHRYLQFYPSDKVQKSVAANPGWYTFPDETIAFPYGIRGLVNTPNEYRATFYEKDLLVLVGTADTLRTGKLRVNEQADRQGKNRFERGHNFFSWNKQKASESGQNFNWTLDEVPDVGHQFQFMSEAAANILYGSSK